MPETADLELIDSLRKSLRKIGGERVRRRAVSGPFAEYGMEGGNYPPPEASDSLFDPCKDQDHDVQRYQTYVAPLEEWRTVDRCLRCGRNPAEIERLREHIVQQARYITRRNTTTKE